MSRGRKIAAIAALCLAGLVVTVFVAGVTVARTDWFRDLVRSKIVSAVEEATGGKVDIASFDFDWRHLRVQVRGFVIHGLEPPTSAPLLRAKLLQVDLKLLSPLRGFLDIAYLLVDEPQANVILNSDGRTNIPEPKVAAKHSDKTGVETIVDLAIGRFDLRNGSLSFADHKSGFSASGADLRAQVGFSALKSSYSGEIDISPLYVKSGSNPALPVRVQLPFTMEKDRIALANARLSTAKSQIVASGAMDHLVAPRTSAQLNATVSMDEVGETLGLAATLDTKRGPSMLTAEIAASRDDGGIRIQTAHARLGRSDLRASGTLKDAAHTGSVQFDSTLDLSEIGRLLRSSARPEGNLKAGGHVVLDSNDDYRVNANLEARGVAFQQGSSRITGVGLDSALFADPHRIELSGLRLGALGGSFTGTAAVRDMARFQIQGNLHNLDIARMARAFMPGFGGYDGVISGPFETTGNIHDLSATAAKANLAIAPGHQGIPISGRLGVDYNGRSGAITLNRSHLAMPHTTADFSGSLGRQIQVHLVSRDFADFRPLAAIPISLTNHGAATVDATVTGSLSSPRIAGQVAISNFAVNGRPFTGFGASVAASKSSVTIANGGLTQGPMQVQFSMTAGLHNWKPEDHESLKADLTVRNADLRDILALSKQSGVPATGSLNAEAHINGTLGSPTGSANLSVVRGTLAGSPFDSLTARAALNQTAIDIPDLRMIAGPSRLDVNAHYQHALNNLRRGALTAHLAADQIQLGQFQELLKDRPGLRGLLSVNADMAATIAPGAAGSQVDLTSLNAKAGARSLELQGRALGDLTATAATKGSVIRYDVTSNFAGSSIRVNGQSALAGDHRTSANASIANLPIDRVLAIAGRRDVPLRGTLSGNAEVSGTLKQPEANVRLTIANGSAYRQPFSRMEAALHYTDVLADLSRLYVEDGPSHLEVAASFTHPPGEFQDGQLRWRVASNAIPLGRIHPLTASRPGLAGVLQVKGDGEAVLRRNTPIAVSSLNANISAHNIKLDEKDLGGFDATASTRGRAVDLTLTSDVAKSRIRGSGRINLAAGYPIDARLSFSGVTWAGLRGLLDVPVQPFDASVDGQVAFAGSAGRPEDLRGTLQLTKLEAHSTVTDAGKKPRTDVEMHNAGNIDVSLANSVVTVQSFRLTGPYSNVAISGSGSIKDSGALHLQASGKVQLEMLQAFNTDISSAGAVALNAAVTGTASQPVVHGRLQLQDASFHLLSLPNGLSNANGAVNFNGTEAAIDNLTGEVGGGKITLAGVVSYGGPETRFRMQATAANVRVDYPASVTVGADAHLTLNGTESRSLLAGNVTILNVALHSHSDVGSILTSAAAPPSSGSPSTGILRGMRFDVRVQTSPDVEFRTSLSQNLEADADLSLRGSPDHPGMIGRVVVTSGDVVFFGAKYTIDDGSVSFYDPSKINPILRLDLGTSVQGIDVTISVTGPMDKLKLAYHSDPPLDFQQIVSLLASGKTPTTDPVLAAHQPVAPAQNVEQAGLSAIVGQAVANPVSGRLQRLFGVSKLSINPQIVGDTSNNPQATLTLQQQITREITFTYIQDVSQTTPSAIRIEWAISPQFSAIAQRDVYGKFALDFFYKKRFR